MAIVAVAAANTNGAFGLKLGVPPAAPSMHSGTTPRSGSHAFLDPKERYEYGGEVMFDIDDSDSEDEEEEDEEEASAFTLASALMPVQARTRGTGNKDKDKNANYYVVPTSGRRIAGSKRVADYRNYGPSSGQGEAEVMQSITAAPGLAHTSFEVKFFLDTSRWTVRLIVYRGVWKFRK